MTCDGCDAEIDADDRLQLRVNDHSTNGSDSMIFYVCEDCYLDAGRGGRGE